MDIVTSGSGEALKQLVRKLTGAKTVPQIWIGGEHIGGASELQDLDNKGELDVKLAAAGAIPK